MLNFVATCPDPLHDAMNSIVWALRPYVKDDTMKNIYIAISSVRNAYDLLVQHLTAGVATKVSFTRDPQSEAFLRELWELLGLGDDIINTLIEYRIVFMDGRLWIWDIWARTPHVMDHIVTLCMAVWKFIKFTESRWLTLANSCRALIASEMVGLRSCVEAVRADKTSSDYYIKGYARIGAPERELIVIAGLGSGIADGVMGALLKDDRVVRRLNELEDIVETESIALHRVSDRLWTQLAITMEAGGARELRSKTIQASNIIQSFINYKIFEPAKQLPWTLCKGDASQNLHDLAAGPKPDEPFAGQLWELMQIGYPILVLCELLGELENLGWSSRGSEQPHAAAAQTQRHHPEFQDATLMARSMIYQFRALVTTSSYDSYMMRVEEKVDALMHRKPKAISGRQLFLKESLDRSLTHAHTNAVVLEHARAFIFKEHAIEFNKLSPNEKSAYDVRARAFNVAKAAAISDDVVALRAAVDEAELESIEYVRTRNPWNLEHCKFTESQKDAFETWCRRPQFSHSRVEQLRANALVPPPIPDYVYRLELAKYNVPKRVEERRPLWVAEVCRQRDYFTSCVLVSTPIDPDEPEFCAAFMWAYQSPLFLSLACLARRPFPVLSMGLPDGSRVTWRCDWCQHDFDLCGSFIYSNNEALTTYVFITLHLVLCFNIQN